MAHSLCRKNIGPLQHIEKDIDFGTCLSPEKFRNIGAKRSFAGQASTLIGYMRVSKADGSQVLDLQRDALVAAGVTERQLYGDTASGKQDDRPGLLPAFRHSGRATRWLCGSLIG